MASWSVLYAKIVLNCITEANDSVKNVINKRKLVAHRLKTLELCKKVDYLMANSQVDANVIQEGLISHKFDVNILWLLFNTDLITPQQYFEANSTNKRSIGGEIADFCFIQQKSPFEQQAASDMIKYLEIFYCNSSNDYLLSSFTKNSFLNIGQLATSLEDGPKMLEALIANCQTKFQEAVYLNMLKEYVLLHGKHFLDVLRCVDEYRPRSDAFYEKLCILILSKVDPQQCLLSLTAVLIESLDSGSDLNWNHISTFVLWARKSCKEFTVALKHILGETIENALNDTNATHLYAVFLLGRILALEEIGAGINYLHWYTSTFSSESSRPLNTVPRAKFFLKAMSDIIDLEPPYCLKAHVHKACSVPASCQGELAEYIQLAKARLLSLNESIEIGFFDNKNGGSAPANDVLCLIDQFEATNKLSSTFLAALTFRKHYFEKTFLPTLYETCPGKNSTQHTVIKKLHDLGKISNLSYKKHDDACI